MSKITEEMDQMAEQMSKSTQSPADLIKATVLELGPEGLKKAVAGMDEEQKELLKEVLGEMAKSHKKKVKNPKKTAEPVINTTPNGDYLYNEDQRMAQDFQDEKVMDEVQKDGQATPRNQGGVPVEGWEGQMIKGCEPLMKDEKEKKEEGKEDSSAKEAPKGKKRMEKSEFVQVITRMQEREMEKSACVEKLCEVTGFEKSKIDVIWDELSKAESYKYDDGTVGKDIPEAKQSETPECKDTKKVPEAKAEDRGGDSKTTADEGEKPPATMKKSGEGSKGGKVIGHTRSGKPIYAGSSDHAGDHKGFTRGDHSDAAELHLKHEAKDTKKIKAMKKQGKEDTDNKLGFKSGSHRASAMYHQSAGGFGNATQSHEEYTSDANEDSADYHAGIKKSNVDENFTLQKARNPFAERNIGQNCHYDVDSYLANEYVEGMKKSSFDYEGSKDLKKSNDINDLIEKSLDMDGTTLNQAINLKAQQEQGACFVKSFSDDDFEEIQKGSDLWEEVESDDLGKSEALEKSGEGSRGGKVIGHTKSGKPIYANGGKTKGYKDADHQDAADAHNAADSKAHAEFKSKKQKGDHSGAAESWKQVKQHRKASEAHESKLKSPTKTPDRQNKEFFALLDGTKR